MSTHVEGLRDALAHCSRKCGEAEARAERAEQQAAYYKQARRELLDRVDEERQRAEWEADMKDRLASELRECEEELNREERKVREAEQRAERAEADRDAWRELWHECNAHRMALLSNEDLMTSVQDAVYEGEGDE